jgi:hypothetical protein
VRTTLDISDATLADLRERARSEGRPFKLVVEEVRAIVESWLAMPHVRLLPHSSGLATRFFDALTQAGGGGNLTTDALIAAQAMEAGGRVFTNDRDFARFPALVTENPL